MLNNVLCGPDAHARHVRMIRLYAVVQCMFTWVLAPRGNAHDLCYILQKYVASKGHHDPRRLDDLGCLQTPRSTRTRHRLRTVLDPDPNSAIPIPHGHAAIHAAA